MEFSTILDSPTFRSLVQVGLLEKKVHDTLFPWLMFRDRFDKSEKGPHEGTDGFMSRAGLIEPDTEPYPAGQDPSPTSYTWEQWTFLIQQYTQTLDVNLPTSVAAAFSLFENSMQKLAEAAGRSINKIARNAIFNAGLAGNTVTNGSKVVSGTSTTLPVMRLNGFTTARVPTLAGASTVRYEAVSAANPLDITIAGLTNVKVVGYTPTYTLRNGRPDTMGPGSLLITHDSASLTLAARTAVLASDRSRPIRVGGGSSIDSLSAGTDLLTIQDVQSAHVQMRDDYVPYRADGYMHCDLSPQHQQELINDPAFQRLYRGRGIGGDNIPVARGEVAEMFNVKFFENTENPKSTNVVGGSTASYDKKDAFGAELFVGGTTSGAPIYRSSIVGLNACFEKYVDLGYMLTEAGLELKSKATIFRANGLDTIVDDVKLMIRQPLNRLQDQVAITYSYQGDFNAATDGGSGDAKRYKRITVLESV